MLRRERGKVERGKIVVVDVADPALSLTLRMTSNLRFL
jgi:hypothetical protein